MRFHFKNSEVDLEMKSMFHPKINDMKTMSKLIVTIIIVLSIGAMRSFAFVNSREMKISLLQEKKTAIKVEELPEAVRKSISENYKGWAIARAFVIAKSSSKEYEVVLTMNEERKTVTLDKEGKVIQ